MSRLKVSAERNDWDTLALTGTLVLVLVMPTKPKLLVGHCQ